MNKQNAAFWKVWNSKFGNKRNPHSIINNFNNDQEIASNFADYFAKTCNVNSVVSNNKFVETFSLEFKNYEGDSNNTNNVFNIYVIDNIVRKLHVGKATGLDNLTAEDLNTVIPFY